MHKVQ